MEVMCPMGLSSALALARGIPEAAGPMQGETLDLQLEKTKGLFLRIIHML